MATILVVDDRALNREFLAMLLGYAGHRILEATNGLEALERAGTEQPDLVISDIVMPTMDGVDFANRMHADPVLRDIPIIFYTATYRLTEARRLALSCDVSTVIPKPSRPQVILEMVAHVLERSGHAGFAQHKQPVPNLLGPLGQKLPADHLEAHSLRPATLSEVTLELTAQRDPQRLLDVACRAAKAVFDARYAAIATLCEGGGSGHFAVSGFPEAMRPVFTCVDLRTVLNDGKPRRLHDQTAAAALLPAWHPRIRTLLIVPLKSAKRTIGWFYVADRSRQAMAFTEDDEQIAVTIATLVAQRYENCA
jgi:diguanylate cyclase